MFATTHFANAASATPSPIQSLIIINPGNKTYNTETLPFYITLQYAINVPKGGMVKSVSYSINGEPNVTITETTNFLNITSYGHYNLTLYALDHLGNIKASETTFFTVTLKHDLNGDGTVDIFDAIILLNSYGASTEDPNYNEAADFDSDGFVNLYDAVDFLSEYKKSW